jgi:hypothetical protein
MRTESPNGTLASPGRLLEMLTDRFGAFEAIAMASIKLARHVPEDELSMDKLVAEAVLEFGDDLRAASEAATRWTGDKVGQLRPAACDGRHTDGAGKVSPRPPSVTPVLVWDAGSQSVAARNSAMSAAARADVSASTPFCGPPSGAATLLSPSP